MNKLNYIIHGWTGRGIDKAPLVLEKLLEMVS